MLTRRLAEILCLLLFIVTVPYISLSQDIRDGEIRSVPAAAQERIQQYFDYRRKENWEKLYEIDDWEIRNKEDYIAIHIKDKTNPYIKVQSYLEIALEDKMRYFASSNKWAISGCSRIIDREGKEQTVAGSIFLSNDNDRGWIVGNLSAPWYADGFHECKKNMAGLPIKIR